MSSYPNLSSEKIIALDLETHDPNLLTLGPGYHRANAVLEDSQILTVAVAVKGRSWAFLWNEHIRNWLKDNNHLSIIGANTQYDLGWLYCWKESNIFFNGVHRDILINESLIDAGRSALKNPRRQYSFSLSKCAEKYLGVGKGIDELKEYCISAGLSGDPRKHIKKIMETKEGTKLVLKYNESDTQQTWDIYKHQLLELEKMGLLEVFSLESELISPLLEMRKKGVRIDLDRLNRTEEEIGKQIKEIEKEIKNIVGFEVNVNAPQSMQKAFDSLGLSYPTTDKGNPSFSGDFLGTIDSPFPQKAHELRGLMKLQNTYLEGFEKFLVKDRVYTEFHQVKNGTRGTDTGRFSATRPALQTIPKRGAGTKIARGLYVPEEGYLWESQDQSQQELRVFAHFARGGGAEKLRDGYINDPKFDHHNFIVQYVGWELTKANRGIAKTINFGANYGMGLAKFAMSCGLPVPPPWEDFRVKPYSEQVKFLKENYEAARLFLGYHEKFPCIKETAKAAQNAAEGRGYAKTILGRRRYLASGKFYTALNMAVQGSSAEASKLWLRNCWKNGLFKILTFGLLVHDEMTFSKPKTKEGEEAAREVKKIGETCITFRVPLKIKREHGERWSEVTLCE